MLEDCAIVSSSCSFLLPPGLHTSQSRSSLWLRPQRDLYFELSQTVRSWSPPSHGQAGWSAPPHLCQSGGSLLPGAPCIGLYMASLIPLCRHIGLVFLGTGLPCGSRWQNRPRWSRRKWCCAWWAKSAQSRCSCGCWSLFGLTTFFITSSLDLNSTDWNWKSTSCSLYPLDLRANNWSSNLDAICDGTPAHFALLWFRCCFRSCQAQLDRFVMLHNLLTL